MRHAGATWLRALKDTRRIPVCDVLSCWFHLSIFSGDVALAPPPDWGGSSIVTGMNLVIPEATTDGFAGDGSHSCASTDGLMQPAITQVRQ